jgi:predicted Fe-Mo cluster-binding NifX family protein
MKVAVPTDEMSANTAVCVSFGRAPYFLIRDTETGTGAFHTNPAAAATGGAGVKAAQFLADRAVNALITVRAGENAAALLTAAGVTVWKAAEGTAEDNLKAFSEGKLPRMTQFSAGFHGKQ